MDFRYWQGLNAQVSHIQQGPVTSKKVGIQIWSVCGTHGSSCMVATSQTTILTRSHPSTAESLDVSPIRVRASGDVVNTLIVVAVECIEETRWFALQDQEVCSGGEMAPFYSPYIIT